jgi:hypothetical protein
VSVGALVGAEEEQAIARNRAANRPAVLVPRQAVRHAFAVDDAGEGIRRVEAAVAIELEEVAGEPVGAGFGDRVDRRAGVHAVLRRETGRRHAEFLERIRERQRQVGVVLRVVVHGAVEQVRHAEGQPARHRHVDAAAKAAAVGAAGVHGRSGEHEQGGDVAPLERQLDDALAFHDFADAGAANVDERRRGFNRHGFREVAQAERHVDGGRRGHLEDDAGLRVRAEPLEHHFQPIGARRQVRHEVGALAIGDHGALGAGIGLRHGDRGPRKNGSALVGNLAGELRGGNLREGRSGQQETECADGEHPQKASHEISLLW